MGSLISICGRSKNSGSCFFHATHFCPSGLLRAKILPERFSFQPSLARPCRLRPDKAPPAVSGQPLSFPFKPALLPCDNLSSLATTAGSGSFARNAGNDPAAKPACPPENAGTIKIPSGFYASLFKSRPLCPEHSLLPPVFPLPFPSFELP